ncbi:MAG: heme biosynthesis protein HemY, partial [Alphaproteobacteria bacterium]|nr:heme biosynthesis protein HemY [Alphaproteobacteria bacterium]
ETNPLSLFLEAQAARLNGDEEQASHAYLALMKDKDAGFMGIRGLLQGALDRGDYGSALELGHKALCSYPKQGWILSIVYDLEVQARNWDKAGRILTRAEKAGAITPEKAASDRVAILLAQALECKNSGDKKAYFRAVKKAYRLDSDFLPSALWLADLYIERGKYKTSIAVIEKFWKKTPHPELTRLWAKAYKPPRNNGPVTRIRWFERLLKFAPDSVEGLQAMASVLTQEGLWGDARKHLEMAEKIRPNVHLYKLWAQLEEKATGEEGAVRAWEEKAAKAPRERVWICSETGRVYDEWMPISDQGLFNTIIWDFPQGRSFNMPHLQIARPVAGLIGSAL